MIRPAQFGMNKETAASNSFQSKIEFENALSINEKAQKEFDQMVDKLRGEGIDVKVFQDTNQPINPDAVFPNNWISTHSDGNVVVYPMMAKNRQTEYRKDIVEWLVPKNTIDIRNYGANNHFLEGTGSLVFDHEAKIVYVGISPRTDIKLAEEIADKLGFTICSFNATDHQNNPIYHTNVVMFVMNKLVVVGLSTIKNDAERNHLVETIRSSGKEILELDYYQITQFSGNMIQLQNKNNQHVLVASDTAWLALSELQKKKIENQSKMITVNIPTIELYGGGSARCMITENFI